nr:hypothetical protein [Morchella crassipes]
MAASPLPPLNSFILIFSPALPYHNLDYENNPCLKGKGDLEKTCLFLRHALVERSSTNVKKNNKSPPLFLGKTMEKGEGCRSESPPPTFSNLHACVSCEKWGGVSRMVEGRAYEDLFCLK